MTADACQLALERVRFAVKEVGQLAATEWVPRDHPWTWLSEADLWRGLTVSILGSQVSHTSVIAAAHRLELQGLGEPWRFTGSHREFACRVRRALRNTCGSPAYRFPVRGAQLLAAAAKSIYVNGQSISALLQGHADVRTLRRQLVHSVPGIGPKQASLFLTDIGYSEDLAILDRHVIKYLRLISPGRRLPSHGLQSCSHYEDLETVMRSHAGTYGLTLAAFDTVVWVVIRVWSREYPDESRLLIAASERSLASVA